MKKQYTLEKLGYERKVDNNYWRIYQKEFNQVPGIRLMVQRIRFNKDGHDIILSCFIDSGQDNDFIAPTINLKELKAINTEVERLEW